MRIFREMTTWKDNIKMDLIGISCENMNYIEGAQNEVQS